MKRHITSQSQTDTLPSDYQFDVMSTSAVAIQLIFVDIIQVRGIKFQPLFPFDANVVFLLSFVQHDDFHSTQLNEGQCLNLMLHLCVSNCPTLGYIHANEMALVLLFACLYIVLS